MTSYQSDTSRIGDKTCLAHPVVKQIREMTSVKFNSVSLHADVLCVRRYHEYTLAGIGSNLFVYSNESLLLSEPVFVDERIHSICIKGGLILLKGGRKLCLLELDGVPGEFKYRIVSNIQLDDWIQDVVVLENQQAGLVTAHNCFECWDLKFGKQLIAQSCEEKFILYSCKIIGDGLNNIVVFCGTVFGEVLIWSPYIKEHKVLQRLKAHNGAVFSIDFRPSEKLLTTTSDDRSLKIWSISSPKPVSQPNDWRNSTIQLIHNLFGHTARVWRSLILPEYYITIGEDSQLITWSRDGRMIKTLCLHQESGIRALDYSSETNVITTGGEDGGINAFTLNHLISRNEPLEILNIERSVSTKICFTADGVVYTSNGNCIMVSDAGKKVLYRNENFSSYSLLEVSLGGEYIVMGSIKGHLVMIDLKKQVVLAEEQVLSGRVYSIHWLGQFFLTCGPEGRLDLWELTNGDLKNAGMMTLPACKERWTTCGAVYNENLILGDRMGNIYVYKHGKENPVKSFRKIHGYLGVTDVFVGQDVCLSVGRNGTLKEFSSGLDHFTTCKLPMEWPWKIVRYENDTLILGFHGVSFIVWSMKEREVIASHDCGGGHRSCDYKLIKNRLSFLYVKDKKIFSVDLILNGITRIRNGFHGKEINCLKILQTGPTVFVTGSEDTTLRIARVEKSEIKQIGVLKTHVSSVRDICVCPTENTLLIVSVGGKGQIVLWEFDLNSWKCHELIDYRLKKENRDWKSPSPAIDPETRIMCADIFKLKREYLIAAGCSDCQIRIFSYKEAFSQLCAISYTHCVLNVTFLELGLTRLLISMATDGKIVIWDVKDCSNVNRLEEFSVHQSGINSFHFEEVGPGQLILATGGDDNMISVAFLEVGRSIRLRQVWESRTTHSCQVTGIKILKPFLITTSIDQRVTVWKWSWQEGAFKGEFLNQYMTAVPDIQGMDAAWLDNSNALITVYGKGIEIFKISDST